MQDNLLAFNEAVMYLKQNEIVYTISKGAITYFYQSSDKIKVKSVSAHYDISLDDFVSLFSKEQFYLYIPKDQQINLEKDNEYYSWKSKGIN